MIPGFKKYVSLKFNNAVCTTLIGAYYLLFQFETNKKTRFIFPVLALIIILISGLTLLEHLFNINTGIDQLFFTDRYGIAYGDKFPGRMIAQAATVFLLFGLALLGFSTKNKVARVLSQYAMHLVSLIVATLLIGFIYSDKLFNNIREYGLSFLYEGSLFFIMSVTASFLCPTLGITRLFTGNLLGNKMARRLFILITVMVLFFGLIKEKYLSFKVWQFDTGFSLFIVCILLVSLLVIWYTANWLNRMDLKRYEAEKKLKLLNENLEQRVKERTADLTNLLEKYKESELKFRTLAEKSMVGIYISQKEKFIYVNPRFAEIFGYEPQEMLDLPGSAIDIIIDKEDQATVRKKIYDRYHGETDNAHYQVRGRKKDGTYNYVEFFGNRVIIDGEPSIIGTMLDITARKSAEEELRLSELKYKLIFESNPLPLWMIAKDDLSIISVNEAAADLYGYTKDELLQKNVTIFRPVEELAQQSEIFREDLNGSSDLGIVRQLRKDGSVMFVHIIAYDIIFEGRKVRLSLTTDVTEKLKAEGNLKKYTNAIEEQNKKFREIAWLQSHIVRAPLARMMGIINLLKDNDLDIAEHREFLKHLSTSADKLDAIIKDITNKTQEIK